MTGKELYDRALNLLSYKNADGTDNGDCTDMLSRAPDLINVLLAETFTLRQRLTTGNAISLEYLNSLEDTVPCEEPILGGVLPYGLAALLIAEEDKGLYKEMYDRYLINTNELKEKAVGVRHDIDDCYAYYGS